MRPQLYFLLASILLRWVFQKLRLLRGLYGVIAGWKHWSIHNADGHFGFAHDAGKLFHLLRIFGPFSGFLLSTSFPASFSPTNSLKGWIAIVTKRCSAMGRGMSVVGGFSSVVHHFGASRMHCYPLWYFRCFGSKLAENRYLGLSVEDCMFWKPF